MSSVEEKHPMFSHKVIEQKMDDAWYDQLVEHVVIKSADLYLREKLKLGLFGHCLES